MPEVSALAFIEPIRASISATPNGLPGLSGNNSEINRMLHCSGHRQAMRECCAEIEVLYELDVMDDWLQREVYGGKE